MSTTRIKFGDTLVVHSMDRLAGNLEDRRISSNLGFAKDYALLAELGLARNCGPPVGPDSGAVHGMSASRCEILRMCPQCGGAPSGVVTFLFTDIEGRLGGGRPTPMPCGSLSPPMTRC